MFKRALQFVHHYHKAIAGFVSPAFALFVASASDGSITSAEWDRIVTAGVAGALGVGFAKANGPKPKARRTQAGIAELTVIAVCAVILTVVGVLWWFGVRPR